MPPIRTFSLGAEKYQERVFFFLDVLTEMLRTKKYKLIFESAEVFWVHQNLFFFHKLRDLFMSGR